MSKFIEKVKKTCQENQKVAMFIDMDGTIAVYNVYPEDKVAEKMEEDYDNAEPLKDIIKTLEKISLSINLTLVLLLILFSLATSNALLDISMPVISQLFNNLFKVRNRRVQQRK